MIIADGCGEIKGDVGVRDLTPTYRAEVNEFTPLETTQINATLSELNEGIYPVYVENQLGVKITRANLVVASPVFSDDVVSLPGVKRKILFNTEYQSLYMLDASTDELVRASFDNETTSWVMDSIAIPQTSGLIFRD